jgi:hypothetical protein
MIFLTTSDEDKKKFELNHRNIIKVEDAIGGSSNIKMSDGHIISVLETKDQIKQKAMDYDVEVISQALRKLKEETGGLI